MERKAKEKLIVALKSLSMIAAEKNLKWLRDTTGEMVSRLELGLEVGNLEQIRALMKLNLGYDPLEQEAKPGKAEQTEPMGAETKKQISLQDLKERIYAAAKADKTKRFWGLYVHVCKLETLREAYRMAKENDGAPGIDGVTIEDIEAGGTESFLEQIRNELVAGTYQPMRTRKVEIPKGDGKKTRTLSIPAIRDRVVQGALKLILEPIFETDFQSGSFGYRPDRTAHEAVGRVARAMLQGKLMVIDLDLKAFFDNVRHHILFKKVARRVNDDKVMHLLKLIVKATGGKGVPQGGVISPLLSNIYLNEVDETLEREKEVTRYGRSTQMEYARFADDMVVLVGNGPRPRDEYVQAIGQKLREELAKLQVEVNEEKTRIANLGKGESIGFLGFTFQWHKRQGKRWIQCTPKPKKRSELTRKLRAIFRENRSQPVKKVVDDINPILRGWVNYFRIGNASRTFKYVKYWVERKIRRHMMRAKQRKGYGWKRWSSDWIYKCLKLYNDYEIRYLKLEAKASPSIAVS